MLVTTLPPVSNRAGWSYSVEVLDDDTGEPLALAGLDIVFEVRDDAERVVLSATIANGKLALVDTGVFAAAFARDQMATLRPGTYRVGCTISDAGDTAQLIIGRLPVLDGIVSP